MSQTFTLFSDVIAELRQLCRAQRTGTLHITTSGNHPAQISLAKGEIVFLVFRGKLGADALPLMLQIDSGRSRFVEGAIPAFKTPLPPTADILGYLAGATGQVEPLPSKASAKPSGGQLSEPAKAILEKALAEYIGPMAAIVCAEHFEATRDLESAVEALAGEIPKSEQAAQFRAEVRKKLTLN